MASLQAKNTDYRVIDKEKAVSKIELEDLTKTLGDKNRAVFFLTWVKCGLNATKAYQLLHPNVTYQSCRVLGAKTLASINIHIILSYWGMGIEEYFKLLHEGLFAEKWDIRGQSMEPDHQTRKHYHDKLGRLLGLEKQTFLSNNMQVNIRK